MRIAQLGNVGSGKLTLARRLARSTGVPLHEVDRLLWRPGWQLAPESECQAEHSMNPRQPPTKALFGTAWTVDRDGMPEVRALVADAECAGTDVRRIAKVEELAAFEL